jgi:hypothetical protein
MRLDARTATHYEAKKTRSGSEMYKLDRRSAERMTWELSFVYYTQGILPTSVPMPMPMRIRSEGVQPCSTSPSGELPAQSPFCRGRLARGGW